jgi:abortive infection bacteriophage resistance protein
LQALTVLRKLRAHHSRIWNRNFPQAPLLSHYMKNKVIPTQHKKIFALVLVIYDLLRTINREKDFYFDLTTLFNHYPDIDLKNLGFSTSLDVILRK